jgi:hypothetical protein
MDKIIDILDSIAYEKGLKITVFTVSNDLILYLHNFCNLICLPLLFFRSTSMQADKLLDIPS